MTRKRFVKLLMAAGYDRNEANAAAADTRIRGIEYSTAVIPAKAIMPAGLKWDSANIDALCDAVRKIADAAQKVALAIGKAIAAFAETYTAEMEANHE